MSKPIVYVDMEGTILTTKARVEYYDLIEGDIIRQTVADNKKTINYWRKKGKTLKSDPNLMVIPRPNIKRSLSRLAKHTDLILLSGASYNSILESITILGLDIFQSVYNTYDSASMRRPMNEDYWLIDDTYNVDKLKIIDPTASTAHLMEVAPYEGRHVDRHFDLVVDQIFLLIDGTI